MIRTYFYLLVLAEAWVANAFWFLHSKPTPTSQYSPAILSALYGYDDCIGGVNSFDTEEEYMEDLKRRNCTVVIGPNGQEMTNVAPALSIRFLCKNLNLEWMDGMPVVFNFPLKELPEKEALEVTLSDGTTTTPDCLMLNPANEENEMDTLLLLGQFGDGAKNTVHPVQVSVVGSIMLVAPDGEVDAKGVSYQNEGDMNYLDSSVRLSYARMWDVSQFSEGTHYPTWPLPSSTYPNTCEALYPSTTHIIRMAFSGGITLDGVTSVRPNTQGIFTVRGISSPEEIPYLGLADLGKTVSVEEGSMYESDGDNYLDICMDLGDRMDLAMEDLVINLNCDPADGSVLYPPKGKPYGCKSEQIILTDVGAFGYFSKYWTSG